MVLSNDMISKERWAKDFDDEGQIGEGGFGKVFKARHRIDGNYYAVKKVKLNKKNHEETSRMLREVKYLSSLNHAHIVRYFQTWVEAETNPKIIAMFESSEEEYGDDDEYDSEDEDDESWMKSKSHLKQPIKGQVQQDSLGMRPSESNLKPPRRQNE